MRGPSNTARNQPGTRDVHVAPLLVRFGRLGDMVLQIPLLHLLHRRYLRPCIVLTSGPWSAPLFAGNGDVGEIWQLQRRHVPFLLSPERWRLIARLRQHQGPIYVTEDSQRHLPRIRRLLALAGIPADHCVFLDDHPFRRREHWVNRLLRFGRCTPSAFAGLDALISPADMWRAPRLPVRAIDRIDRDDWMRERGFGSGHPLILLQPGNKRALKWGLQRKDDPKAWPIERWTGLMTAMLAQMPTATLLLCGSSAEHKLLDEIRRSMTCGRVVVAADDLPIRRLIGVLEIAHSMVSVDTGPAHLAAAVGCPLIVLYGAESALRWGRRSPVRQPVIELGGRSDQPVRAIPLDHVVEAWSRMASGLAVERSRPARRHQ